MGTLETKYSPLWGQTFNRDFCDWDCRERYPLYTPVCFNVFRAYRFRTDSQRGISNGKNKFVQLKDQINQVRYNWHRFGISDNTIFLYWYILFFFRKSWTMWLIPILCVYFVITATSGALISEHQWEYKKDITTETPVDTFSATVLFFKCEI